MHLTKNGLTIIVEDAEVVRMVLDRLAGSANPVTLHGTAVPRIGEEWHGQGGIYAGIARGRDGAPEHHLIVGPEYDGDIDWAAAIEWSSKVRHEGHTDYGLFFRAEAAVCFGNVPSLFNGKTFWTCEQHASDSDYAWGQDFGGGGQGYWGKFGKLRARVVRRLVIQ